MDEIGAAGRDEVRHHVREAVLLVAVGGDRVPQHRQIPAQPAPTLQVTSGQPLVSLSQPRRFDAGADVGEKQVVEGETSGMRLVLDQRPPAEQDHQILAVQLVQARLCPEPLHSRCRHEPPPLEDSEVEVALPLLFG
jgi:hypothetical protein